MLATTDTLAAEAGFHAHLSEHPDDLTAWLAYSDWLQDRDDPLLEGVRAVLKVRPKLFDHSELGHSDGEPCGWVVWKYSSFGDTRAGTGWWGALDFWRYYEGSELFAVGKRFRTKFAAMHALATAFLKLTPDDQSFLLAAEAFS